MSEEDLWVHDDAAAVDTTDRKIFDDLTEIARNIDIASHETQDALSTFGKPSFLRRNWMSVFIVSASAIFAIREGTFRYQDAVKYMSEAKVRPPTHWSPNWLVNGAQKFTL